jgi:hypothetical protein
VGKRENQYQSQLIKRIQSRWPDAMVLKNDEQYIQGIPDLTVLHPDGWGALEVKRDEKEAASPGPNQQHYVDWLNDRGFAAFVHPSNEEEVLDALQRSFEVRRAARLSQSE